MNKSSVSGIVAVAIWTSIQLSACHFAEVAAPPPPAQVSAHNDVPAGATSSSGELPPTQNSTATPQSSLPGSILGGNDSETITHIPIPLELPGQGSGSYVNTPPAPATKPVVTGRDVDNTAAYDEYAARVPAMAPRPHTSKKYHHAKKLGANAPSEWTSNTADYEISEPASASILPTTAAPTRAGNNGEYDIVRVFFGTDRSQALNSPQKHNFFGNELAQQVTFGNVDVSIPRNHMVGGLESPSILRLEINQEPNKHVTVLHVNIESSDQFFSEMRSKALNSKTPSALLFIHGYNVSFDDAARRTAQIAYDLDFSGAAIFFSWPSRATLAGYTSDEQSIERAQPDIEQFVSSILKATPDASLYVVAHSMGTRGLTRALLNIARQDPTYASRIKEIVLAAPDIDSEVFVRQIAPGLVALGAPVTLYASSRDRALALSEIIHAGPRAGDSGRNMVLLKGIETIDVTNVDTDFTGHSYVGDRRSVLSDLYYIVHSDTRAEHRFGLSEKWQNGMQYWLFAR
ncbi:alpha/beta hydrolase [Burkholderia pyrrocinia]|uniref:alpha/beta hydrolase n=1 Tax=Burkholderia pyrrocinia TaxID=60550 RepID=UPI001FB214EF|nr:alpha/beta hydrolase [Burkholderia pyrrocinia]UOB56955.1 alpha/beta hydrolase [Burkholderia pyrrocinia]